jgi:hypothetical protein
MITIHEEKPPVNAYEGAFINFENTNFTIGLRKENYKDIKLTPGNGGYILSYYALRCTISSSEAEKLFALGVSRDI